MGPHWPLPQRGSVMGSGNSRPSPLVGVALPLWLLRLQLLVERDWRSWKLPQGWKRGCYLPACGFCQHELVFSLPGAHPGVMLSSSASHPPARERREVVMTGESQQMGKRHPLGRLCRFGGTLTPTFFPLHHRVFRAPAAPQDRRGWPRISAQRNMCLRQEGGAHMGQTLQTTGVNE